MIYSLWGRTKHSQTPTNNVSLLLFLHDSQKSNIMGSPCCLGESTSVTRDFNKTKGKNLITLRVLSAASIDDKA